VSSDYIGYFHNTRTSDGGAQYGIKIEAGFNTHDDVFQVADGNNNKMFQIRGNGNVEASRSGGNFGIGVSPTAKLQLKVAGNTSDGISIQTTEDGGSAEYFKIGIGTPSGYGASTIFTRGGADGFTSETMRLTHEGRVAIGTSTAGTRLEVAEANNPVAYFRRQSSDGTVITFFRDTTSVGTISVTTSNTAYNTSSDYRLKDNIADLTGATSRVAQLQPRRFNFIAEPSKTVDGFVAHEVSDIVPEAITGDKDGNRTAENVVVNASGEVIAEDVTEDQWTAGKERTIKTEAIEAADAVLYADGDELPEGKSVGDVKTPAVEAQDATYNDPIYAADTVWHDSLTVPVYQGIDQAKLVPLLTAAVQELTARVAALEAA
jgi:hypothetical protein